jgi:N-acetylglucosaminyl-diphospho-decaprenol L-rhamnosyltransferase
LVNVDVVVVAYRSADHLRSCVEVLLDEPDIRPIVVNNACPERSTETLKGFDLQIVEMGRNAGFAAGSNAGARAGTGEAILFMNPDARISPADIRILASALEEDTTFGAVGPRILEETGETQLSMRRAPRLRSAFGEALWLHHLARRANWPTEIVRKGYDAPTEAEWLTGAVLLVRRDAFEQIGGFDERLFMYSEDTDLCLRLGGAAFSVRYEPRATAIHEGGASTPRAVKATLRAQGRIEYVRLHERGPRYFAFRVAFALNELLRIPRAAFQSRKHFRGRVDAFYASLAPRPRWLSER